MIFYAALFGKQPDNTHMHVESYGEPNHIIRSNAYASILLEKQEAETMEQKCLYPLLIYELKLQLKTLRIPKICGCGLRVSEKNKAGILRRWM